MLYQKIRKVGNSYVVTIPKDEVERLDLQPGQLVAIHIQPAEVRPVLPEVVRQAFEQSWQDNEAGYRYLAER